MTTPLPPITLVGRIDGPAVTTRTTTTTRTEAVLLVNRRAGGDPDRFPIEAWGSDAELLEATRPGSLVGVIGTITTGDTDPGAPSFVVLVQRLELLGRPLEVAA